MLAGFQNTMSSGCLFCAVPAYSSITYLVKGVVAKMALSSTKPDQLLEEEISFAAELKSICNDKGKENDPNKSADIFHRIGLIYWKRCPDKMSLIRSAALLNAATTRQPSNQKFKDDLKRFCTDLLRNANAKLLDADLLVVSGEAAEMITQMRRKTKENLKELKQIPYDVTKNEQKELENQKIECVKRIQTQITDKYKQIMQYIANECEKIMGDPPCKYSITGMGSLARYEITPYSDFEHIILLEEGVQMKDNYDDILEHFRWFSVIFHVIVINLEETIVPSVAVPTLNDFTKPGGNWFFDAFTKRGISFDGILPQACKMPLGRTEKTKAKPWTTELIRPVSGMLEYLDKDEDLKNGYHLADILLKVCFVSGDENIHQRFAYGVKVALQSNKDSHHETLMRQLEEDLQNFHALKSLFALQETSQCNVKRVVYRSITLFISALGRLHSIDDGSSFAIIDQLKTKEVIDDVTAHLLSYAVAVSCEVRLSVYMKNERQDDYVGDETFYNQLENKVFSNLIDTVGEKSVVDFFLIAENLQRALRNEVELNTLKLKITLNPVFKFNILHNLRLYDRILINEWESYLQDKPALSSTDDGSWIRYYVALAFCVKNLFHKALKILQSIEKNCVNDAFLKANLCLLEVDCLKLSLQYQEALQVIKVTQSKIRAMGLSATELDYFRGLLLYYSGQCNHGIGQYNTAILEFLFSIDFLSYAYCWPKNELHKADCFRLIGWCLYELGSYDKAMVKGKMSLQILQQHNSPISLSCFCNKLIGRCYLKKAEFDKAFEYFLTELDLRLQFVPAEKQDSDTCIQGAKQNIQMCLDNLK
ncbi:unnamed protein product [Clavelina lepadiformis]|uniref:Protein-PII uridylyltransferase N-terminal domain-containing protein n=1 Tax=Clavelina lepadiformis TaxID=159417 RepID=A0ABP0GCK1_CLALP